jgi:hypothetical protein
LSELEVKGEWTKWTTGRQNGTTKRDDETVPHLIPFVFSLFSFFFWSLFSERNSTI